MAISQLLFPQTPSATENREAIDKELQALTTISASYVEPDPQT